MIGSGKHSLLCRRAFGSSRNPPNRGEGTRDEALRTSGREAKENLFCLPLSRARVLLILARLMSP